MAIFGDLGSIARRAATLAKEHGLGLLARSLLLIVSLFAIPLFGVGLVFAGVVIFGMYSAAMEKGASRGGRGRTLAMVATGVAVVVVSVVAGLAENAVPVALPGAVGVLASALIGMVLAPLHLASVTLLAEDRSLEDALGRVVVATTGRGGSVAAMGAIQGVLTVGVAVLVVALIPMEALEIFVVLSCLVAVGSVVHVVTSVAGYEALVKEHRGDFRAPRLGRVGLVLAPAMVAFGSALLYALAAPLPAWIDRPVDELDARGASVGEVVTETGLTVAPRGSVLVVSVADGGGCGAVGGFSSIASPIAILPTTFRGRPAFEIGRRGHGRVAFVDADGVRLDDTLGDRLHHRTGPWVFVPLALAALLIAALIAMLRAASRTASLLGARTIEEAPADATIALIGALRLDEGAKVSLVGRERSRIEGYVRFESKDGALTTPIEEGVRALGQTGLVRDGAPAFVVARASELRARTHRSAPARRALLFGLGTLDDARTAFLAHESRRLVWLGVPGALAIFAAAGAIVAAR